ncbi:MAG: hypothetical protein PVI30_04820 [Myxococcales bacterium]|jgi:hypothetical protein
MNLPPCGLYRTTAPVAGIPAGRLVYFHNHGDPGPGLYLPEGWSHNRMQASRHGRTLQHPEDDVRLLEPLPPEGFYRVTETFHCCEKKCRLFEPEMLLQLGYNAAGEAIAFVPELVDGMLAVPTRGSRVEPAVFDKLRQLRVPLVRAGTQH